MKGYKGFSKGLICRGKQYAENTVFEEENAEICHSGMHFCKNPFDVLEHYGFVNEDTAELNEFCEVEALGGNEHGRLLCGNEHGQPLCGNEHGQLLGGNEHGQPLCGNEHGQLVGGNEHGQLVGGNEHGQLLGGNEHGRLLCGNEHGRPLCGNEHGRPLCGNRIWKRKFRYRNRHWE